MHEVLLVLRLDWTRAWGAEFCTLVYANLAVSHKLFRDSSARQKRDPQRGRTHCNSTDVVHSVSAELGYNCTVFLFLSAVKYYITVILTLEQVLSLCLPGRVPLLTVTASCRSLGVKLCCVLHHITASSLRSWTSVTLNFHILLQTSEEDSWK